MLIGVVLCLAADPFIYVGTVAAMVLSAMLATWHPARRAARVDPIVTLKIGVTAAGPPPSL
jgi:ABC-type lipoprotein release transport system permease subunit